MKKQHVETRISTPSRKILIKYISISMYISQYISISITLYSIGKLRQYNCISSGNQVKHEKSDGSIISYQPKS